MQQPPSGATRAARSFGLPVATALVLGNIVGGGIFALPASAAGYGTVSLVAFAVLTAGAVALALVFARLAHRAPQTGGPYVYARLAFGDFGGFLSAWSYWITTWVSNAALAVAVVGYADVFLPLGDSRWTALAVSLVCLWLPTLANLAGTRYVGAVQLVSTVLKFIPLLIVAVGGLFFLQADNFGPFTDTPTGHGATGGGSVLGSLSAAAALLLFSYLGVESASVSAGQVRDPKRNVGRATVLGTCGAAAVYLLGTLAVFGMVPHERLTGSAAPFADAFDVMFGSGGALLMAVAAVVSMLGALNGWTLLSAQTPYAAARDGLFPARFATERRGVPVTGVLVSAVLASVLTVANFAGGASGAFRALVLLTSFTATVPYLLSAAAQLYWLATGARQRVRPARLVRDTVLAVTAFGFSLWMLAGAGYQAVYQGVLLLFGGLLVHVWMQARRGAPGGDGGGATSGEPAPTAEAESPLAPPPAGAAATS